MQNREHHSKNKYCDEQNGNLWWFYIVLPLGKADAVMFDVRRLPIMEKEEWWCLTNGGRSDCFHMIKQYLHCKYTTFLSLLIIFK